MATDSVCGIDSKNTAPMFIVRMEHVSVWLSDVFQYILTTIEDCSKEKKAKTGFGKISFFHMIKSFSVLQ